MACQNKGEASRSSSHIVIQCSYGKNVEVHREDEMPNDCIVVNLRLK